MHLSVFLEKSAFRDSSLECGTGFDQSESLRTIGQNRQPKSSAWINSYSQRPSNARSSIHPLVRAALSEGSGEESYQQIKLFLLFKQRSLPLRRPPQRPHLSLSLSSKIIVLHTSIGYFSGFVNYFLVVSLCKTHSMSHDVYETQLALTESSNWHENNWWMVQTGTG